MSIDRPGIVVVLAACALLQLPVTASGQPIRALERAIENEMDAQDLVGLAVGIVDGGRIIYTNGFGSSDPEGTQPIDTNTVFRWASISKTLTAVAAFQLIEAERLELSDVVTRVVPYWTSGYPRLVLDQVVPSGHKETYERVHEIVLEPGFWSRPVDGAHFKATISNKGKITVKDLVTNRSGINHYVLDEHDSSLYKSFKKWNAKQSVQVFEGGDILFEPATLSCYSTFGFVLLGAVIDEVAHGGYVDWIETNIKNQLGMASLTEFASGPGGYEKNDAGKLYPVDPEAKLSVLPGGGWSSDIRDLTAFMQALISGSLLNDMAALWDTPLAAVSDWGPCGTTVGAEYRHGVEEEPHAGLTRISHGGAHDGLRTYMAFYPSEDFGVALMINGGDYVDYEDVYDRVAAVFGYK